MEYNVATMAPVGLLMNKTKRESTITIHAYLSVQGSALVEYNMATMAPVGLLGKVPPRCYVRLIDAAGNEVQPSFATTSSNSPVAAVEVVDEMTGVLLVFCTDKLVPPASPF